MALVDSLCCQSAKSTSVAIAASGHALLRAILQSLYPRRPPIPLVLPPVWRSCASTSMCYRVTLHAHQRSLLRPRMKAIESVRIHAIYRCATSRAHPRQPNAYGECHTEKLSRSIDRGDRRSVHSVVTWYRKTSSSSALHVALIAAWTSSSSMWVRSTASVLKDGCSPLNSSPGPLLLSPVRGLLASLASINISTMFCKASLITVALALIASASPIVEETGIRIPLAKRSSLTKADGTFDHEKAILHNIKTHKYVVSDQCPGQRD